MRNIGEAVEFLHCINIAHRDLKVSYCIAIIKHQHYITLYTIVQKFGVSKIFFITFIQQECNKLSKGDCKHIFNININIKNKY